jgi:hypothetical protein
MGEVNTQHPNFKVEDLLKIYGGSGGNRGWNHPEVGYPENI